MPTGVRRNKPLRVDLPKHFEIIKGETLVKAKAVARLAGVSPVSIEIANKLMSQPNTGAQFKLGDKKMLEQAELIELTLVKDLRKVIRGLDGAFKIKSVKDGERMIFWLDAKL